MMAGLGRGGDDDERGGGEEQRDAAHEASCGSPGRGGGLLLPRTIRINQSGMGSPEFNWNKNNASPWLFPGGGLA
jgi:hypothetical protein